MKRTDLLPSLIITGMALGTAWAVRGQFGHEHGASWAGSVACLTIILLSARKDWYKVAFNATLAGALGWGLGGMMSYGKLVGYGRSIDFGNVYYGLFTLFVVAALYGFMGGGLFGMALSNTPDRKPIAWHRILVEMTVGGIIFYFFVIEQFGWEMTPPRDEHWAICAGMAAALAWYMVRQKMSSALRVALITGFGAGFGFAFGNFLQVLGGVLQWKFNFWNVMEYSLGFFGGASMAYAVFTSEWEEKEAPKSNRYWLFPVLMLVLIIPSIMWEQNTNVEKLRERFSALVVALPHSLPAITTWTPYLVFIALSYYWINKFSKGWKGEHRELWNFYLVHSGLYILLSIVVTGAFLSTYRIEQYLYLVNFAVIVYFLPKLSPPFSSEKINWKVYVINFIWFLVFNALLTVIATQSHDRDLPGAHYRFGEKAD